MDDSFDRQVFEALDSMQFNGETEQLVWERLENRFTPRDEHRSPRRQKIIVGGLTLAMAASLSAFAIATVSAHQPTGEMQTFGADSAEAESSDAAVVAEDSRVQEGRDERGSVTVMPEWSVPISDDITLIMKIMPDGSFVISDEKAIGECLGTYSAIEALSGQVSACEVYARLDSNTLYSIRFDGNEHLYDAFVQPLVL